MRFWFTHFKHISDLSTMLDLMELLSGKEINKRHTNPSFHFGSNSCDLKWLSLFSLFFIPKLFGLRSLQMRFLFTFFSVPSPAQWSCNISSINAVSMKCIRQTSSKTKISGASCSFHQGIGAMFVRVYAWPLTARLLIVVVPRCWWIL